MQLELTPEEKKSLVATMQRVSDGDEMSAEETEALESYYNDDYFTWVLDKDGDGKTLSKFEELYLDVFMDLYTDLLEGKRRNPGAVGIKTKQSRRPATSPTQRIRISPNVSARNKGTGCLIPLVAAIGAAILSYFNAF